MQKIPHFFCVLQNISRVNVCKRLFDVSWIISLSDLIARARSREKGREKGREYFASRNTIVGSQQIAGNTQRSETSGETDTRVAYAACEQNRTRTHRGRYAFATGILSGEVTRQKYGAVGAKLTRRPMLTYLCKRHGHDEYETICRLASIECRSLHPLLLVIIRRPFILNDVLRLS